MEKNQEEKKVQIYIIRHGETQSNIDKLVQGQTDSPLTPLGKTQVSQKNLKNP